MKKLFAILLLAFAATGQASAQPQQMSAAEILQGIKKLNTVGAVLYVAAHPDDENTRLLTYLSRERNVRTGYISLTRGDGGQNLIGKEQGEALGLIRTHELLGARRTDGAEQFFTRANDFGFSKNPEETFRIWNKDSVLADLVWAIRRFKPDVIICRFPTTGEGGHGHHTASAILAVEAFDAAANPARFPDQLQYTSVWQTRRIFWNTFNFGTTNTTSPDQLKIDVGGYNALLGKSYGEIAAESRSMHKSQGFGSARTRGAQLEYFKLLNGDSVKNDILEKVDVSWKRMPEAASVQKLIADCIQKFDVQLPEKSVPALIAIYKALEKLPGRDYVGHWREQKMKETEALILACAGIWLEATAASYTGIPGRPVDITTQAISRSSSNVKLNKVRWFAQGDSVTSLSMKANELYTFKHKETIPASTQFSNPYWLNQKHSEGLFTVHDQQLIGKPENDPALKVLFDITIGDLSLQVERGVIYKTADPVKGEIYRPFEVLPPATVNLSERVYVFAKDEPKKMMLTIKANADNIKGTIDITVPEGWKFSISSNELDLKTKGDEKVVEVMLTPGVNSATGKVTASLKIDNASFSKSIRRIEYDHIPYQFILENAEAKLVKMDLKKEGNRVGYIAGAGDDVPAALIQAGYDLNVLTDELLAKEDLSKYDAIVTGVRAYNTNDRLQVHYDKLMNYVKEGGNLIVQYNTNNRIGPIVARISPYPLTITRERVTNEGAEVRFLKPDHKALNFPNKITEKDFEGWVQERGIYFAGEIDKNYEAIFSMNDPGEKASEGSLIIAKYGEGNFVYTGIAFFRQLPAGVPGAYRLFANLISLPEN